MFIFCLELDYGVKDHLDQQEIWSHLKKKSDILPIFVSFIGNFTL